jgi:hypothetical protein
MSALLPYAIELCYSMQRSTPAVLISQVRPYPFLRYSVRKSHIFWAALYFRLWPVWVYHVYQYDPVNGTTLSINFVWNITHSKRNSARYCHKCTYVLVYQMFLPDFNGNWTLSTDFLKKHQITNFMKIRLLGAELLFHADRQTDMTKLIVIFRQFAKAPKKLLLSNTHNPVLPRLLPWSKDYTDLHRSIFSRVLCRPIATNSPLLPLKMKLKFYDKSAEKVNRRITRNATKLRRKYNYETPL